MNRPVLRFSSPISILRENKKRRSSCISWPKSSSCARVWLLSELRGDSFAEPQRVVQNFWMQRVLDVLFELRCGWCSAFFYMCRAHFRNHRYCSDSCRQQARTRQIRRARRRYRRSKEGRLDHRDRMRLYRRLAVVGLAANAANGADSVVDQTTSAIFDFGKVTSSDDATRASSIPGEVSDAKVHARAGPRTCIVCGRASHFVLPFGEPWPRRR